MKIALVVPGFSREATDWAIPALQSLACRLAQTHDVHIFSLRYPAAGHYRFCRLVHHATGGGQQMGIASLDVMLRTLRAIVKEHRAASFDLLHGFWVDEPAFTALLAARLLRRPLIASVGGGELTYLPQINYGTAGSPWRRRLVHSTLARADLVTAGSTYQAVLCTRSGALSTPPEQAPLGVDCQFFRPAPAPPGPPTLIQAASLVPVKGQGLLLEVVARVSAWLPDVRLLLAGDGPERLRLEAQARALGLTERVQWLGWQPYWEMPTFYSQGHLYLQTSHHESQGMAVLEAMACGLPVLGTPVGLLPQVAALPAIDDPERLAEQVSELLSDPGLRAAAGATARTVVKQHFSLEKTAEHFQALYQACRGGFQHSPARLGQHE